MNINQEFFKFQNCGNDFIIIDDVGVEAKKEKIKELTKTIMKRKYSVGANNVLYLHSSPNADAFMRIYNCSNIEGNNCGNGSLCVAKYLSGKLKKEKITIETIGGGVSIDKIGEGKFKLKLGEVKYGKENLGKFFTGNESLDTNIQINEKTKIKGTVVQIGEPHLVIISKGIEQMDLQTLGNSVNENKKLFPFGINVELIEPINENTIKMRVYERSCFEETEACGTGSCCSAFITKKLGLINGDAIKVLNKGGELTVQLKGKEAYLIGSPEFVYKGYIEV